MGAEEFPCALATQAFRIPQKKTAPYSEEHGAAGLAGWLGQSLNGTTVCDWSPRPWIPSVITSPFFK
jgi:hypothetical protein